MDDGLGAGVRVSLCSIPGAGFVPGLEQLLGARIGLIVLPPQGLGNQVGRIKLPLVEDY